MIVTTYKTLENYFKAFYKGNISLLIISSEAGLGKSNLAQKILDEKETRFFGGHATPLSIYLDLSKKTDDLVCFDDVDSLLYNKINIGLLKQICEVHDNKKVRYSTTHKIDKFGVQESFTSNNKVVLLCNDVQRISRKIGALFSRGIYIDFQPSKEEIINKMKTFPDIDKEIFEFITLHNKEILELNFRIYTKCAELKEANIDWKNYVRKEFGVSIEKEVFEEIKDLPIEERDKKWEERTGRSIRTLQRLVKEKRQNEG